MLPLSFWFTDKNGPNGRNRPGMVWINRLAQHKTAVYGQECFEAMHKMNPVKLFYRLVSKQARRDMEYLGHEIEIQIKMEYYGLPESETRYAEAASMQRGYDGLFSHMSTQELVNEMRMYRIDAIRWIKKNHSDLVSFYNSHG